jgi:sporulation protein YtfJ
MSEHPIEGLMKTAMNSIQDMVDVNIIIGEPIETSGNIMIIPISKVCFGFAAGGSEFNTETLDEYKKKEKEEEMQYKLPFGGGSGAGVTINPVAFLVINNDNIKLMPICHESTLDKIVDYVPDIIEKFCKKDESENEDSVIKNIEIKEQMKKQKEEVEDLNEEYLEDE